MPSMRVRSSRQIHAALVWRINRLRRSFPVFDRLCWTVQARPRVVDVAGIRLNVGRHISAPVLSSILDGDYEEKELSLLREVLTPADRVMELGTGLGFLAAYCARLVGSDRVATFEGNVRLEPHIRKNFALNSVSPSLSMCLVGAESGERTFYLAQDFWGSSTIRRSDAAAAVTVPVRCFNDEVRRIRPSVVIMDIEGGEVELAPRADLGGVRAVVIELHERIVGIEGVRLVKQAFAAQGFHVGGETDPEHCLFVR